MAHKRFQAMRRDTLFITKQIANLQKNNKKKNLGKVIFMTTSYFSFLVDSLYFIISWHEAKKKRNLPFFCPKNENEKKKKNRTSIIFSLSEWMKGVGRLYVSISNLFLCHSASYNKSIESVTQSLSEKCVANTMNNTREQQEI